MRYVFAAAALACAASSATMADCARYQEMLAPVAVNFEGVSTTHMTDNWRVLLAPVRGAEFCTILKKTPDKARAGLNCTWPFAKSSEAEARRHLNDWANALQGCRPQQRKVTSSKAMREREVERILYKAADGDEGWAFVLFREPNDSWVVSITPTLQKVGPDRRSAGPAPQPALSAASDAAPAPLTSVGDECVPYRDFSNAARSGFRAYSYKVVDNQRLLDKPLFDAEYCVVGLDGRGGNCGTWSKGEAAHSWAEMDFILRVGLAEMCLPGWKRTDIWQHGPNYKRSEFLSPDGVVQFGVYFTYDPPTLNASVITFANRPDQPEPVAAKPAPPSTPSAASGASARLTSGEKCGPTLNFVSAARDRFGAYSYKVVDNERRLDKPFFGDDYCGVELDGRGGRCATRGRGATAQSWAENEYLARVALAETCLSGWRRAEIGPRSPHYKNTEFLSPDGVVKFGITFSFNAPTSDGSVVTFANRPEQPKPVSARPAPSPSRHSAPTCAQLNEMLVPVRANFRTSRIASEGTRFLLPPVAGAENCVPVKRTASNYAAALSCTWRIDAPDDRRARGTYAEWSAALKSCKPQLPQQATASGGNAAQMDNLVLGEKFAQERWAISLHHDNPYRIMIMGFVRDVPP
jgi:hypothetical protein